MQSKTGKFYQALKKVYWCQQSWRWWLKRDILIKQVWIGQKPLESLWVRNVVYSYSHLFELSMQTSLPAKRPSSAITLSGCHPGKIAERSEVTSHSLIKVHESGASTQHPECKYANMEQCLTLVSIFLNDICHF